MFSGTCANYTITTAADGTTVVTDNRVMAPASPAPTASTRCATSSGCSSPTRRWCSAPGLNDEPAGALTISDDDAAVNQLLTVRPLASRTPTMHRRDDGDHRPAVSYVWQVETDRRAPACSATSSTSAATSPRRRDGTTFRVTADLDGLALRVRAIYQDGHGVLENVFSAPTAAVAGGDRRRRRRRRCRPRRRSPASTGVHFIRSDLDSSSTRS